MTVHQQEAVGENWLEKMAQLADSQGTARPWNHGGMGCGLCHGNHMDLYNLIYIYIYYMIGRLLSLNEFFLKV